MRKILIIGSGKSSSYLIKYLLSKSEKENLFIIIADKHIEKIKALLNNHSNSKAIKLDVFDNVSRAKEILASDIVISMLPARFHLMVAKDCIKHSKNIIHIKFQITVQYYISPQIMYHDIKKYIIESNRGIVEAPVA